MLPPHLSPFVEEKEGDYVPPERFGQRQAEEDVEEEPVKEGSASRLPGKSSLFETVLVWQFLPSISWRITLTSMAISSENDRKMKKQP